MQNDSGHFKDDQGSKANFIIGEVVDHFELVGDMKKDDDSVASSISKHSNNYFEETYPVSLAWQKNSCFIDSLIQCFLSSHPLQQAILESDSTWKIPKWCAFLGLHQ